MPGRRLLDAHLPDLPPPSLESAHSLLPEVFTYHLKNHFTGEFMVKVDGATMHYGLEARAPLLDQHLWEFGAALPFSMRMHRWRLKALLREICRRRIGARIANRPKQGFLLYLSRVGCSIAGRATWRHCGAIQSWFGKHGSSEALWIPRLTRR